MCVKIQAELESKAVQTATTMLGVNLPVAEKSNYNSPGNEMRPSLQTCLLEFWVGVGAQRVDGVSKSWGLRPLGHTVHVFIKGNLDPGKQKLPPCKERVAMP